MLIFDFRCSTALALGQNSENKKVFWLSLENRFGCAQSCGDDLMLVVETTSGSGTNAKKRFSS
jgi:hypothetical protein